MGLNVVKLTYDSTHEIVVVPLKPSQAVIGQQFRAVEEELSVSFFNSLYHHSVLLNKSRFQLGVN